MEHFTADQIATACANAALTDAQRESLLCALHYTAPVPAAGVQGDTTDDLQTALTVFDMGLGFALCHCDFGDTRAAIKELQKDFAAICATIRQQAATVQPDSGRDAALEMKKAIIAVISYGHSHSEAPTAIFAKELLGAIERDDRVAKALAAHPAPSSDAGQEVKSAHGLLSTFCVGETKDGKPASLGQRITELYQWYYAATQPENGSINDEQRHAIATCINGGVEMGWVSDDMARSILVAHPANGAQAGLSDEKIREAMLKATRFEYVRVFKGPSVQEEREAFVDCILAAAKKGGAA